MQNNTTFIPWSFQPGLLPISLAGYDTNWLHVTYVCQGFLIATSNYLIVAAIGRYEALRTTKEFFLMMALALADALNMTGFFFAGIYRLLLVSSGQWEFRVTAWQCMATPQNLLFSFSQHMASMMLTIISIDRLICVSSPLMYLGLTRKYCMAMVLAVYIYSIGTGVLGVGLTWHTRGMEANIDARCVTSSGLHEKIVGDIYAWHYKYVPTVFSFASVILYMIVWVQYKKRNEDEQNEDELKRQKQFTESLGICCICTFWLYCIPYSLAQVFNSRGHTSLPLFCWIISNFNAACNIFIYSMRHEEMKSAIKGLFWCKAMPTDIRMWRTNQAALSQAYASNMRLNDVPNHASSNAVQAHQHPVEVEVHNL